MKFILWWWMKSSVDARVGMLTLVWLFVCALLAFPFGFLALIIFASGFVGGMATWGLWGVLKMVMEQYREFERIQRYNRENLRRELDE